MIKFATSLVLGLGILSVSGIALADEQAVPDTKLPAEVTQCLAACSDAAQCCAENKANIELLQKEIEKINKRLNPTRKPGHKPVDRVKDLDAKLTAAIASGDAETLKKANAELEAALKDYATLEQLTAAVAKLQGQIDSLKSTVSIAVTKNAVQDVRINNIDARVTNIENAKENASIDFLAKIGVLVLRSDMFDYNAGLLTVGLDFPLNASGSVGLVVEGGAAVSNETSDHGGLAMAYGRFDLPGFEGFALTAGADILAAGPDSMVRWAFTSLMGDGGLQYTNGFFTANVNGILGAGAHHNGEQGLVGGLRINAGGSF